MLGTNTRGQVTILNDEVEDEDAPASVGEPGDAGVTETAAPSGPPCRDSILGERRDVFNARMEARERRMLRAEAAFDAALAEDEPTE